jgi:hypothetical protein
VKAPSHDARCCAQVRLDGMMPRYRQCQNRSRVFRAGGWYCGVHDPERRQKTRETNDRLRARKRREWLLARNAPKMLRALEVMLTCPGVHTTEQESGRTYREIIEEAIK